MLISCCRTRVEQWSLPAPARLKDGPKKVAYVVTDACLLGDSSIVMVHETGPHPASIVRMPDDYDVSYRFTTLHNKLTFPPFRTVGCPSQARPLAHAGASFLRPATGYPL
jgi:hypothetical protein